MPEVTASRRFHRSGKGTVRAGDRFECTDPEARELARAGLIEPVLSDDSASQERRERHAEGTKAEPPLQNKMAPPPENKDAETPADAKRRRRATRAELSQE